MIKGKDKKDNIEKISDVLNEVHSLNKAVQKSIEDFRSDCNDRISDLQNRVNNIHELVESHYQGSGSKFEYKTTDVTDITNRILSENPTSEIHIICYGRNGYGDVIEYIKQHKLNVTVEVIVYNPTFDNGICLKNDETDIKKHLRNILDNSNVKVNAYASNTLPSVRACAIYKTSEPKEALWGTMQSYRFKHLDGGGFTVVKPEHSLIIVCGKDNSPSNEFYGMIDCFEAEFKALKDDSVKVELENGEIIFGSPPNISDSPDKRDASKKKHKNNKVRNK